MVQNFVFSTILSFSDNFDKTMLGTLIRGVMAFVSQGLARPEKRISDFSNLRGTCRHMARRTTFGVMVTLAGFCGTIFRGFVTPLLPSNLLPSSC